MKTKTKSFADELLANPKLSSTEAYIRTHETTNRRSASVNASKLLANPSVSIYLLKHVSMAKKRIVELAEHGSKEETQLRASQDILDRTFGKAVQRAEIKSSGVFINIDLTSSLDNTTPH